MQNSRRASTLLTVLLCAVGLGMVALCVVSALLSHYNLAVRYRDSAQSDWLARAAVAEFVSRCEKLSQDADVTSVPTPLLPKFRDHEVLLAPSEHVPATVTLLLDPPFDSRDNTLSPVAAQSCFDAGSQKSIPPFSLDLALKVEAGGRTFLYQALVQQRWPYAVAAPGPIRVLGRSDSFELPLPAASQVKGSILAMQTDGYTGDKVAQLKDNGEAFYTLLLPFSVDDKDIRNDRPALQVGGTVLRYKVTTKTEPAGENSVIEYRDVDNGTAMPTSGALVKGGADLYPNVPKSADPPSYCQPKVVVDPASNLTGTIRPNFWLGGQDPRLLPTRLRLSALFVKPDTSSWSNVDDQVAHLRDLFGNVSSDVLITSHPGVPSVPGRLVIYVPSGKVRCHGLDFATDNQLVLEDCSLACDGDLRLQHLDPASKREVLRGTNATLIVGGQLYLDGGELDAGGNGMVIFSNTFLIRASGHYNGLLIGQEGGAFFGQGDSAVPGLVVRGGVLLGSNRIRFHVADRVEPMADNGQRTLKGMSARSLREFTLASTRIEYDPQYMRGLNQFGGFHLQALVRH